MYFDKQCNDCINIVYTCNFSYGGNRIKKPFPFGVLTTATDGRRLQKSLFKFPEAMKRKDQ